MNLNLEDMLGDLQDIEVTEETKQDVDDRVRELEEYATDYFSDLLPEGTQVKLKVILLHKIRVHSLILSVDTGYRVFSARLKKRVGLALRSTDKWLSRVEEAIVIAFDDPPCGLSPRLKEHPWFKKALAKNRYLFAKGDAEVHITPNGVSKARGDIEEIKMILEGVVRNDERVRSKGSH
jgi:hypothetical protein